MAYLGLVVKALPLLGRAVKTLGQVTHMSDLFRSFTAQSKNVTMFTLGDWVKLKIGNEAIVTRRKTLTNVPNTMFTRLVEEDKYHIDMDVQMKAIKDNIMDALPLGLGRHDENAAAKDKVKENIPQVTIEEEVSVTPEGNHKVTEKVIVEERKEGTAHHDDATKVGDHAHTETKAVQEVSKGDKFKFEKDSDGYYVFDRDPTHFPVILNYMRNKEVILEDSDPEAVLMEARYYRITPMVEEIEKQLLNKRRKKERIKVMEADDTTSKESYFMIERSWGEKWYAFVFKDGPVPPSIDNTPLVDESGRPKPGLKPNKDYFVVRKAMWVALWDIYCGGPILARDRANIYDRRNPLSYIWSLDSTAPQAPAKKKK
eukprot:TRINITY_DN3431_c0_g1_i2.p1 TRINITY_DN3431_c0_g1~~TRINITY_DN3431_c0_g1_i2.p1  ORF type:complete len:371 (-),score=102.47 TRINITY_DN3431_c0_g1_i2:87-1199(-)